MDKSKIIDQFKLKLSNSIFNKNKDIAGVYLFGSFITEDWIEGFSDIDIGILFTIDDNYEISKYEDILAKELKILDSELHISSIRNSHYDKFILSITLGDELLINDLLYLDEKIEKQLFLNRVNGYYTKMAIKDFLERS